MKYFVVLTILLLIAFSASYANTGCLSSFPGSNWIYTTRSGTYTGAFGTVPKYLNNLSDGTRFQKGSVFCYVETAPVNSCWIDGTAASPPQGVIYGTLVSFSLTPTSCPLDDYIWLLILPLGVLGFYFMRKRSLLN